MQRRRAIPVDPRVPVTHISSVIGVLPLEWSWSKKSAEIKFCKAIIIQRLPFQSAVGMEAEDEEYKSSKFSKKAT